MSFCLWSQLNYLSQAMLTYHCWPDLWAALDQYLWSDKDRTESMKLLIFYSSISSRWLTSLCNIMSEYEMYLLLLDFILSAVILAWRNSSIQWASFFNIVCFYRSRNQSVIRNCCSWNHTGFCQGIMYDSNVTCHLFSRSKLIRNDESWRLINKSKLIRNDGSWRLINKSLCWDDGWSSGYLNTSCALKSDLYPCLSMETLNQCVLHVLFLIKQINIILSRRNIIGIYFLDRILCLKFADKGKKNTTDHWDSPTMLRFETGKVPFYYHEE